MTDSLKSELRENDIKKFIGKNPGCSKQDIVNMFANKHSRVTVFKIIGKLKGLGLISVIPNPDNRQTDSIFLETQNIINKTESELDSIELAISDLLRKLNDPAPDISGSKIYDMANLIIDIFSDVVNYYPSSAIMKWPREIKSKRILEMTYLVLFSKVSKILSNISREYPFPEDPSVIEESILNFLSPRLPRLNLKISTLESESKGSSLKERVDKLIDAIRVSEVKN